LSIATAPPTTVQIGLVETTAHRLELRPVDAKAHHVKTRPLHQAGIHLIERRRRALRVGDQRIDVKTPKQHLAPGAIDDLSVIDSQPVQGGVAVVRRRHGGGQVSRGR